MDTQPAGTLQDLFTVIVGDIAKAVSDRDGEARQQHDIRVHATTCMVMSFSPRDAIEAMIAGQCVMLHEMIVDSVHKTLRSEEDDRRPTTRAGIVAMDRAFGANLTRLDRYQTRRAQTPDTHPAEGLGEMDIVERVRRHQAQTPQPAPAQPAAKATTPTPEQIAACAASPEAMAALDAADPARFARAMGVNNPSATYLAAAGAKMAELNRLVPGNPAGNSAGSQPGGHQQGHSPPYAGNRQQRRHPNR
jgi:hypothetical protein